MTRTGKNARYVLDASALLCLLFREPGGEAVEALMAGARISAVNLSEVIAKLIDRGAPGGMVVSDLAELDLEVVAVDRRQAELAGLMREKTRTQGLSLGDRACLALAAHVGATAVTADRAWASVDVGVALEIVR